jgi:hypothetical protein
MLPLWRGNREIKSQGAVPQVREFVCQFDIAGGMCERRGVRKVAIGVHDGASRGIYL